MAGVNPSKYVNYISEFKKILVTRQNGVISQKFKIDSATNDKYYFSIVNSNCRLVSLENRTFKIYGSVFDSKDALRVLFYSDDCTINQDGTEMCFTIETYTSQYMNIVKTNKIIDVTIVEVIVPAEGEQGQDITQVILRDQALAYKRPYIDSVQPTEIVYRNILTGSVPFVNAFGAGEDINLIANTPNFAFGTGLETNNTNQVVLGQYNQPDATKIIVIGNGSNDTARSNLFTIDYDGNITTSGALSATAVYINGQEVGTQVDQKLASTSAWVNETFETKESSTSAYNSLVEEIGAVDLKVDGLSSTVVSDYALKSQLPTKVSDLTNDAGYITSSEIPTDYVTNGQLDEAISSFITIEDVPVYTGSGAVVVDQNHVISLTGQLGKTYNADNVTLELDQEDNTFSIKSVRQKITAGSGISLSEDQQTGITTISVFGSGTPGEAVQYFEGTGISIDDYTISINQNWLNSRIPSKVSQLNNDLAFVPSSYLATYATKAELPTVPTKVSELENDVPYLSAHQSLADYYTKTQTDSAIATATDDMATETYVNTASANIVAQIPNSGTIIDVATGAIPTGVAYFANDAGYLTAHQDLTDYAKTSEVNSAIEAATSGKADLSAVEAVDDKFDNYYTSVQVDAAIETASSSIVGQIPLSTSQLVNDSGYLTQHQSLEGYATETYVDGAIDTASASIVAQIPTSASQLANDVPYLTAHQSLDNYYTKSEVDSAIGTATDDMATQSWVEGQGYLTAHQSLDNYYNKTQVDTALALKADSADVYTKSQVYTKTETDNAITSATSGKANSSNVYTKSQVYTKDETDTEIYAATSGAASKTWVNNQGFAKTADLPTVPTKVSDLQNDAGYLTSIPSEYVTQTELTAKGYLTAVPSEYALKTDIPTYTGASGISVDSNHVIAITGDVGKTYTGGTDIEITTGNVINFTGTIPSIEGLATETYVNNAVSSKADKSELTAYLTAVPAEYITQNELSTELTGYAKTSDIPSVEGFATENFVTSQGYITSSQIPAEYVTESELASEGFLKSIPTTYVQQSDLADYATKDYVTGAIEDIDIPSVEGLASQTYVGEQINGISATISTNYALKSELPSIQGLATETYVNSAVSGKADKSELTAYLTAVPAQYITETELSAEGFLKSVPSEYITDSELSSELTAYAKTTDLPTVPTNVSVFTNDAGYITDAALADYAKTSAVQAVDDKLSAYALSTSVYNKTEVDNALALKANSADVYSKASADNTFATTGQISTYVAGSNISITSSGTNEYTVAATDTTYVEGTGVTISGATNIIAVDQEWLEGFVANLGYLPVSSNLDVVADEETIVMSVDGGRVLSVNTTWLNNLIDGKGFATTGLLSSTSAAIIDLIPTVPTNVSVFTNDAGYLVSSDLSDYAKSADVTTEINTATTDMATTGYVTGVVNDLATGAVATNTANIGQLSTDLTSKVTSSDVKTQVEAYQYQNATQVSGIVEGYNYATNTTVNGIDSRVSANETAITNLSSTKIDATSASGIASGVVQNYITVSGLATEDYVNGQIAQIPAAAEYEAGTGLQRVFDNNTNKYVFNLTGTVLTGGTDIEVSGKSINFTAHIPTDAEMSGVVSNVLTASGVALTSDIPTAVSDLTNDSGYITGITSSDITTALGFTPVSSDTTYSAGTAIDISQQNEISVIVEEIHTSQLSNDAGFITNAALVDYAQLSDIPTVSGLSADMYTAISTNIDSQITGKGYQTAQNVTDAISAASGNIINGLATTDWVTNTVSSSLNTAIDGKVAQSEFNTLCTNLSTAISGVATDLSTNYLKSADYNEYTDSDVATYLTTNNYVTSSTVSTALSSLSTTIEADFPSVEGLISASEASAIASAVTTGYLTGYYDKTSANATFAVKSIETDVDTLKAASGDFSNYYTKDQVVPSTSAAMYNAISGDVDDLITSKNYITSISSSDITNALGFTPVSSDTTYTAGTGLKLTGTEFSLSAAGANEDKVLSSHNGTISWQTNVAGTDIDTVCGMLSSANENLTISKTDNKILFTATGGGGSSYSAGDYISLANDTIAVTGLPAQVEYICGWVSGMPSGGYTAGEGIAIENGVISASGGSSSGPTNKQLVSSGFTYDPTIEIYKNEYTPTDSVITLGAFEVPADSLAENEVATFEEWVTASSSITGFAFDGVILIGELPSSFTDKYYYVFTRRINSNGDQFIKFAYEITTDYYGNMPFTIKSVSGTTNVQLSGDPQWSPNVTLKYSVNGGEWQDFYRNSTSVSLNNGDYVSFSGNNSRIGSTSSENTFKFTGTGKQIIYGNCYSMIDTSNMIRDTFCKLFAECSTIINASKLKLPVLDLTDNSYYNMFWKCTSLTAVPQTLPATGLTIDCYYGMFQGCTGLSSVPKNMLPATTLVRYCYESMFWGCTSLTAAPNLPATTLLDNCYLNMFRNCSNLSSITVAFTDWNTSSNATAGWVYGINTEGTFYHPAGLSPLTKDASHVPVNFTTQVIS